MDQTHFVNFDKYCKYCKNRRESETNLVCDDCLTVGARPNSSKPIQYIPIKDKYKTL